MNHLLVFEPMNSLKNGKEKKREKSVQNKVKLLEPIH